MKRFIPVITLIIFCTQMNSANAQCVPDNFINSAGGYLYPAVLPFAMAKVQYTQVLTFKVPQDTDVQNGPVVAHIHIDSAVLAGIVGVPQGYGYQCNNPGCSWLGGTLGCALLSGISDSSKVGSYPMRVYVISYIRIGTTTPYTYTARLDSSDYTFKILAYSGLFELDPYAQLNTYPNPVNNILTIELKGIETGGNNIELFDATGRKIFSKEFTKPSGYVTSEEVDMSGFAKGLYTVVLKTDGKVSMKKVVRN